jgi:hypothetical protein
MMEEYGIILELEKQNSGNQYPNEVHLIGFQRNILIADLSEL